MGTAEKELYSTKGGSAAHLIDGLSINGDWGKKSGDIRIGCGAQKSSNKWLSMELDAPRRVVRVQLARRMDHIEHGRDIKVTIGSAAATPHSSDKACVQIADLTRTAGMQDYECTSGKHVGKYVKFSSPHMFVICEAKVFVEAG